MTWSPGLWCLLACQSPTRHKVLAVQTRSGLMAFPLCFGRRESHKIVLEFQVLHFHVLHFHVTLSGPSFSGRRSDGKRSDGLSLVPWETGKPRDSPAISGPTFTCLTFSCHASRYVIFRSCIFSDPPPAIESVVHADWQWWRSGAASWAVDDQQVVRSTRGRCITTLGKSLTPLCPCHQAV